MTAYRMEECKTCGIVYPVWKQQTRTIAPQHTGKCGNCRPDNPGANGVLN